MAGFKLEGTDKLIKKIEDMKQRAQELNGTHILKSNEIFTSEFMNNYTEYSSIDELFKASGFKVESNEDLDKIPVDELDQFIRGHTEFPTWKEMITKAGAEYFKHKLGL